MPDLLPVRLSTDRPREDIYAAWLRLERAYQIEPTDPRVAGARAAAEWTLGVSPVSPITNQRKPATIDDARDESHRAAMVQLGILTGDRRYSLGVSSWLFWWTGLEPLPAWLGAD